MNSERQDIQKPSLAAVLIGCVPFLGMCLSVPLWDRITPFIFGLPFNLFWLVAWIAISSGCLAVANRIEKRRKQKDSTTA